MAFESLQLLYRPRRAWARIAAQEASVLRRMLTHTVPWALVPAVSWYVGITEVGWRIGMEPEQRMTPESAAFICLAFYLAMLVGVYVLGWLVHWMAETYAASASSIAKGLTVITYTATPFFMAGVLGLFPSLWFDITAGVLVGCWCIYLLYMGVPIVMHVQPERGFLFASAVFAVALVSVVALMGGTAILWDFGLEPVYTY